MSSILLVDDDTVGSLVLMEKFYKLGYKVEHCVDGRSAIERCRYFHFPLLLIDLYMPKMSGPEVCSILRQMKGYENTPIIAISASNIMEEESELLAESGFSAFHSKPLSVDKLRMMVQTYLLPRSA